MVGEIAEVKRPMTVFFSKIPDSREYFVVSFEWPIEIDDDCDMKLA
jgi:hypothetical protein